MALSRHRNRSRFALLLLVLTSVTLITLDFRSGGDGLVGSLRDTASDALAPVRSGADAVLSPIGDALAGITGYGDLEEDNDGLRRRIDELEGERLRDESAEAELAELSALLDLAFVGDIPTVASRVVGAPVSNFEQTIELDRGSEDGIAEDMPVVSGEGLVGRVVSVTDQRSVVRLLTDPESSVGIRLIWSQETGVTDGEGAGQPLSVGFVDVAAPLRPQELAVTSGTADSAFPPGIPVGRVSASEAVPGDLEQRVDISPTVDLAHLEFVNVLQWEPS